MIRFILGIFFFVGVGLAQICACSTIETQKQFTIYLGLSYYKIDLAQYPYIPKSNLLWMGTNLHDCLENWSLQVSNLPRLPIIVWWYVWNSHNKAIFEDVSVSIFSICFQIMRNIKSEKIKMITAPRLFQPLLQPSGNIAWFDRASQNSGLQCGAGGRIHLCDGSRITWTLNYGLGSNTKSELLGIWGTLFLASQHNILDLHVRGDSKIIIDWINEKGKIHVAALECWKDRIKYLTRDFTQITFSDIFREKNMEADILSKKAIMDHIGILSYQFWTGGHDCHPHCISLF